MLTEKNIKNRFEFYISKVDQHSGVFVSNYDTIIHINEKRFYVILEGELYSLTDEEDAEYCASKNKRFIQKIILMAALTRPRFDANCNMMFDVKVDIWPFTKIRKAKRSSNNRPKDTNELKPVVSVRKTEVGDMIIEKMIPSIVKLLPRVVSSDGNSEEVSI